MRWKSGRYLKPREGERRVRIIFLWEPQEDESGHWRWLEHAKVVEEITKVDVGGSWAPEYAYQWRFVRFVEEADRG